MRRWLLLSLAAWIAPAEAQRVAVHVGGRGACPAPEAVAQELRRLLPSIDLAAAIPGAHRVRPWEDGARFGVEVDGRLRTFDDPRRRCAYRARAVALVVALTVAPPHVALPPEPRPPSVAPALARRAPSPPSAWRYGLEIGITTTGLPGAERDSSAVSFGASLRGYFGRGPVRLVAGISGGSPTTQDLGVARARLLRFPFDFGLRIVGNAGRAEIAGDVGLGVGVTSAQGMDLEPSRGAVRAELAIRGGVQATFAFWGRWAPFVGFHAWYAPSPIPLEATPAGSLGATPRLYLAGTVGAAVRLD